VEHDRKLFDTRRLVCRDFQRHPNPRSARHRIWAQLKPPQLQRLIKLEGARQTRSARRLCQILGGAFLDAPMPLIRPSCSQIALLHNFLTADML